MLVNLLVKHLFALLYDADLYVERFFVVHDGNDDVVALIGADEERAVGLTVGHQEDLSLLRIFAFKKRSLSAVMVAQAVEQLYSPPSRLGLNPETDLCFFGSEFVSIYLHGVFGLFFGNAKNV